MAEGSGGRASSDAGGRRAGSFDWEAADPGSEVVQLRLDLEDTHARLRLSRQVCCLHPASGSSILSMFTCVLRPAVAFLLMSCYCALYVQNNFCRDMQFNDAPGCGCFPVAIPCQC